MKISDYIDRPLILTIGFTSHQLCFLEPLFSLPTQSRIIIMLELMPLVIACLYNTQNDVGYFTSPGSNEGGANKKRKIFDENIDNNEDEMKLLFEENIQEETHESVFEPVCLRGSSIKLVPAKKHFIINDSTTPGRSFNVSEQFQQFQQFSITKCNEQGLLLETHPYHVLSLSSVLLLKSNDYNDDLLEFINNDQLDDIRFDVLKNLGGDDYEDIEFESNSKAEIEALIKKLLKKDGDRLDTIVKLTQLIKKEKKIEAKLILSMINYVQKLPHVIPVDPLGEIELCVDYLDPLLSNIFGDFGSNIKLRWANKVTDESKSSEANVNSQRRPDAVISNLNQRKYVKSRGFGEVKTAEAVADTYCLTKDLIRLAVFSKESIDINCMKANLAFQAVGNRVFFYIVNLVSDGLYVMTEIDDITMPLCLKDLPLLIPQLDKVKKVCSLYEKSCVPNEHIANKNDWRRTTLDSPTFNTYINSRGTKSNMSTLTFR